MLQQHLIGLGDAHIDLTEAKDAVIRFDAASAVGAIVFHVLDENLARVVAPETIRRTIDRLAGKTFAPSIARRAWVAMTNPQRLQWLLTESSTLTVLGDNDMVMLRARRIR